MLKKAVRKKWENEHLQYQLTYVWGMDLNEKHRARQMVQNFPEFKHKFPLIREKMSKQDCHAFADRLGIKRPVMYDMGYNNNNCIGCVKGGMGYWNKIRKTSQRCSQHVRSLNETLDTVASTVYSLTN